jgi:hypothetical protein
MRFEDEFGENRRGVGGCEENDGTETRFRERMVAVGTMFAQTRSIERRGCEKVGGGEESFGEVFEFGERERGGKKDFACGRGEADAREGEEKSRERREY